MTAARPCQEPGCTGEIAPDGYCDTCGAKARPPAPARRRSPAAPAPPTPAATPADPARHGPGRNLPSRARLRRPDRGGSRGSHVSGSSRSGSRRQTRATRTTASRRTAIGAGLVDVPPAPPVDPATVVLGPRRRRGQALLLQLRRPRGPVPRRPARPAQGFCPACRNPSTSSPSCSGATSSAASTRSMGCLAHGGLGWIYLARDKAVNDRWVVLKGLLDSGDEAAMAVAVAERRFLAELDHPNIVVIFNFVTDRGAGYIVMEYVGGRSLKQMLAARRAANGGEPDPLPVDQAIAFVLAILPAFAYLHGRGLLYCDFKPDNLLQVGDQVKLIDLGAVRRFDDPVGDVYGTVGFQAPEIADIGPSVAVRRLHDRPHPGRAHPRLPGLPVAAPARPPRPGRPPGPGPLRLVPPAAAQGHRQAPRRPLPDRGRAGRPDGRRAAGGRRRRPPGGPRRCRRRFSGRVPDRTWAWPPCPRWRSTRPTPPPPSWPASARDSPEGVVRDIDTAVALAQVPVTVEVRLRRAQALIDLDDHVSARAELDRVEEEDPWEWRAVWLRGVSALARGEFRPAADAFDRCRSEVPGELAPKLAAAAAAEGAGDLAGAAALYQVVVTVDPGYVTAARGLARCRAASGDVAGALAAYDRIPATHRAHAVAQVDAVRTLVAPATSPTPPAGSGPCPSTARHQAELERRPVRARPGRPDGGALEPEPRATASGAGRRRAGPAPGGGGRPPAPGPPHPRPRPAHRLVDRANRSARYDPVNGLAGCCARRDVMGTNQPISRPYRCTKPKRGPGDGGARPPRGRR